jgi:hypothetical protein
MLVHRAAGQRFALVDTPPHCLTAMSGRKRWQEAGAAHLSACGNLPWQHPPKATWLFPRMPLQRKLKTCACQSDSNLQRRVWRQSKRMSGCRSSAAVPHAFLLLVMHSP